MGPRAPLPLETTLTHSASLPLKYEVSLALRSASRLLCSVPEAAVVNPGSSKTTHEPASISVRMRDMDGLSVATLISVPVRTFVPPVMVSSRALRLTTTGGCGGAPPPRAPRPPGAAAATGPAAPAGAAPGPPAQPAPVEQGPPALGAPPPGAPTLKRPTSPLHTAAFQAGLISQACASVAMLS